MEKQFAIIEKLYEATKVSSARISKLQREIEKEHADMRSSLQSAYDHDAPVMYLVQFNHHNMLTFYRATKEKLQEVVLTWYESKRSYPIPKTAEEGKKILTEYTLPTNCEVRSYRTFGYFDDAKKRWDREDWIADEIMDKDFLFEVTFEDFAKSIVTVSNWAMVPDEETINA